MTTPVAYICTGCGDFGVKQVDSSKVFDEGVRCPYCKNPDTDWVILGEVGKRRASKFLSHGLDVNGKI